jgi:hypothetical protein
MSPRHATRRSGFTAALECKGTRDHLDCPFDGRRMSAKYTMQFAPWERADAFWMVGNGVVWVFRLNDERGNC